MLFNWCVLAEATCFSGLSIGAVLSDCLLEIGVYEKLCRWGLLSQDRCDLMKNIRNLNEILISQP